MKKIVYEINFPEEYAAGLSAYSETITVTVNSGNIGGKPGEFARFIRDALSKWFDGAQITFIESETRLRIVKLDGGGQ